MARKTSDQIGSIILIALSVAALVETGNFSESAALLPRITLGAILLLSVIQLIMASRVPEEKITINFKRLGYILLPMILYALLMGIVGYYVCTIAFICAVMYIFGIRNKITLIVVPVAFCAFVFLVFAQGLSITLPSGILI